MQFDANRPAESRDAPHGEVDASLQALGEDMYCPHCGYNLRGLTSGRCPECGNACDLATMSRSNIPWLHRAEVGRVRAWWGTCWMALRRPGRMAASINAACPYAEARRFWLINVGVICLPMVAALVWFPITFTSDSLPLESVLSPTQMGEEALLANLVLPWASAMIYRPVAVLACILAVMFATGGVSYVFQVMPTPRRQQGRAAGMALYTSGALMAGPVVWLSLALVALLIWTAIAAATGQAVETMDFPFMCAATLGFVPTFTVLTWWAVSWRLYRRLCHASLLRSVVVGVVLCLTSLIAYVIGVCLIPWCIGLVRIIWLSFQA